MSDIPDHLNFHFKLDGGQGEPNNRKVGKSREWVRGIRAHWRPKIGYQSHSLTSELLVLTFVPRSPR